MGTIALNAETKDLGPEVTDLLGVVPELGQLGRSYPSEVEQIESQHHRAARP